MVKPELIVALDTQDVTQALSLAKSIQGTVTWLKVGLELFVQQGPNIVTTLKDMGFKIFLDLKMYDIPNTVYGGVLSAAKIGADMLTIHVQGGERMAKAALQAAHDASALHTQKKRTIIFGVTVLTSMEQGDLPLHDGNVSLLAVDLAQKASLWGIDGVVSSGHEVASIKSACGNNFLCLTPGIRPEVSGIDKTSAHVDDQRRVMTPYKAITAGANFLVVGRPITKASDPLFAAKEIIMQMNV